MRMRTDLRVFLIGNPTALLTNLSRVGISVMIRQASPRVFRIAGSLLPVLTVLLVFQHRSAAQKAPLTEKDVLPILSRCSQCHSEALKMGGLDLHSREAM